MVDFLHNLTSTGLGVTLVTLICLVLLTFIIMALYSVFFKRFFDMLLSGIAILLLSPVYLVIAILIKIKLGGQVLFCQIRPGKGNSLFKIYKFRSMTNEKDENGELLPDVFRLTPFGKLLRSTSLDELPQLFNIFLGDMSIVGPRPKLVKDAVFFTKEQALRQSVRPGLTGLAQTSGRNNLSWEKVLDTDLKYISKITLIGDIKIILKTIVVVFKRDGINTEGVSTAVLYGDYLLDNNKITEEEYDKEMKTAKEWLDKAS